MTDLAVQPETLVVEAGIPGPPGPPGADGAGFVSADPGNRLALGADAGLFVPELSTDPLAWYLLAKS